MSTCDVFLEVIAATAEDAIAAEAGGAARLEVVRALDQGGLTPPLEVVRAICAAVSIPVRVMVRETATFTIANHEERARLRDTARALADLGVEGLVLGFLDDRSQPTGGVDLDGTAEILACAPALQATFHRAFESVHDTARAMAALKQVPQIDRILVSGGSGPADGRLARLEALARLAAPEIGILAGGSITPAALRTLCPSPLLREFHVGRAAREPEEAMAGVSVAKVQQLIADMQVARSCR